MAEEPTRLQRKIADDRDRLLRDIESGWDEVWSAVEQVCAMLSAAYGDKARCTAKLNDRNSRITVIPAPSTRSESILEIRLNRDEKKIITKVGLAYERTGSGAGPQTTYSMVPCVASESLCYECGREQLSAIELAEQEIVVRLLKIPLPEKKP